MLSVGRVGLEVTPRTVRVAVVHRLRRLVRRQLYAEVPLEPDVFVPAWDRENVRDEEAFRTYLGAALRRAGAAGGRIRVALPDLTARLRILPSQRPPTPPHGLHKYAVWRLRTECVPSPARIAPAFYLNGHPTQGYLAVLVAGTAALAQIERLIREAGAEPVRITTTATALFDLINGRLARRGEEKGAAGILVAAHPSATLFVTSDGAPVFARTFHHTWAHAFCERSITAICAEVAASLDACADTGLPFPKRMLLAGEHAPTRGLAEAMTDRLSIPCDVASLPWRLRGQTLFPPQGIGALAAAHR